MSVTVEIEWLKWKKYQADGMRHDKTSWLRFQNDFYLHPVWEDLSDGEYRAFSFLLMRTSQLAHKTGRLTIALDRATGLSGIRPETFQAALPILAKHGIIRFRTASDQVQNGFETVLKPGRNGFETVSNRSYTIRNDTIRNDTEFSLRSNSSSPTSVKFLHGEEENAADHAQEEFSLRSNSSSPPTSRKFLPTEEEEEEESADHAQEEFSLRSNSHTAPQQNFASASGSVPTNPADVTVLDPGARCRSEKLWRWFVSLGFDERTWDEWARAFAGGDHRRLEQWLDDARLEAIDRPDVLNPRRNKRQSRRDRASEWLRRWLRVCRDDAAKGGASPTRRLKTRAEIVSEANEELLAHVRQGGAVDELKAAIVGLAELFRESLSARQLALYAEALSEFSPEEVKRAIREIALEDPTVTRYPLPSVIRARIRPPKNALAEANEAANRIVGAMEKFGWNNADAAREYIGELGWAVVERQGSWASLCENTKANDIPILKAQWREQAKAIYERARLGHHDTPPAIPAARSAIPLVERLSAKLSLNPTPLPPTDET
jgi:hypothetical protein